MTFTDGGTTLGQVTLSNGSAALTDVGAYRGPARDERDVSGNSLYAPSTASLTQTVRAPEGFDSSS